MTKNIVLKANLGSPIVLWNRTAAAAREHAVTLGGESKAVVVESVREAAAHADVVWSCLKDDAAVSEVYEQLYAQDVKGKLFIDSSSIPGPLSNDLAQRAIDAGAEFVSMPVFGDPGLATIGKLICVPAGAAASIHRTAPYTLDVIAKAVVPLNDQQPGDASTIKLIGNTLIMSAMESIAEALVFAEKTGVGAKSMQSLIQTLFPLPPHSVYLQKMMSGEYCGSAVCSMPVFILCTTRTRKSSPQRTITRNTRRFGSNLIASNLSLFQCLSFCTISLSPPLSLHHTLFLLRMNTHAFETSTNW